MCTMFHVNGRAIYGVSYTQLAKDGGAYVVPVKRGKDIVLVGSTASSVGAGWMPRENVLGIR